MYQRALVSVAKGTEAIAYIGAFGIVAFGNNGICLHSGKCQKRQRIAGNREKGIWDSGESHSSVICTHYTDCIALFLSLCLKTETQGKTDVVIISNNIHTQCSSKTVAVLRNFFAVVSLNTFI